MNWKRVLPIIVMVTVSLSSMAQESAKEKPAQESAAFSVTDANVVLAQLREALEAHSQRKFFALIAAEKMSGYVSFQDQMESFFSHYDGIRVNIRAIEVSPQGDRGIITAGFQMEVTPRSGSAVRREEQMRIEVQRTDKGWRIVDISPRDFFS